MGFAIDRITAVEAIIALAWADGNLCESEKQALHRIIDQTDLLDDEQKTHLHQQIGIYLNIDEIWPKLTNPQDRSYVLNAANMLFHADGEYCGQEQALYDRLYQDHLYKMDPSLVTTNSAALPQKTIAATKRTNKKATKSKHEKQTGITQVVSKLLAKSSSY